MKKKSRKKLSKIPFQNSIHRKNIWNWGFSAEKIKGVSKLGLLAKGHSIVFRLSYSWNIIRILWFFKWYFKILKFCINEEGVSVIHRPKLMGLQKFSLLWTALLARWLGLYYRGPWIKGIDPVLKLFFSFMDWFCCNLVPLRK